jgi:hypothetical protein
MLCLRDVARENEKMLRGFRSRVGVAAAEKRFNHTTHATFIATNFSGTQVYIRQVSPMLLLLVFGG